MFSDIEGLVGHGKHLAGWRLDHLVAELLMGCKQARLIEAINESYMEAHFYRRAEPISAAFAITIERQDVN